LEGGVGEVCVIVLEQAIVDVGCCGWGDGVFEDYEAVFVELFDALLEVLAAELKSAAFVVGDADSVDFEGWFGVGDAVRTEPLDGAEHGG
jgi:hypothetical protein